MSKSVVMRLILLVGSVLILVGVSLMLWMYETEDERNVIEIDIEDGGRHPVQFENLSLYPGQQCEYGIRVKNDNGDKFDLSLDFAELRESPLKNFLRVKIVTNDTVVYDELLADAFVDEPLVLPVDFTESKNIVLRIIYSLPEDVGNEAKNAEALFELIITASTEE